MPQQTDTDSDNTNQLMMVVAGAPVPVRLTDALDRLDNPAERIAHGFVLTVTALRPPRTAHHRRRAATPAGGPVHQIYRQSSAEPARADEPAGLIVGLMPARAGRLTCELDDWRQGHQVGEVKLPLLGPISLTGFEHAWFFLFLLLVLLLVGVYVAVLFARRRRVLRFANMDVLDAVAPARRGRWRHVPTILLVTALVLLTTAMAGPTSNVRIPLNRAVVVLVIDVSESMAASDVAPSRLAAAKEAGKQFADELTPAINLGLVQFAANATLLVSPTTNRGAVKAAIDNLQPAPKTATGEGIFTALQAIATVGAVMGGGDGPPPARIVLESDGAENVPLDPNAPQGAFTAARAAKSQGVQISTISFGTPYGTVEFNGTTIPVPVDDQTLKKICEITDGQAFHADSLESLKDVYATLQQQIGYETVRGDASSAWVLLGTVVMAAAVLAGLYLNRRLPA